MRFGDYTNLMEQIAKVIKNDTHCAIYENLLDALDFCDRGPSDRASENEASVRLSSS